MFQSISPNFYLVSHMVQEIMKIHIRDFNIQFIFMTNITGTCRYKFTVLLNEIILIVEPLDPLNIVVINMQNVTLSVVKIFVLLYM